MRKLQHTQPLRLFSLVQRQMGIKVVGSFTTPDGFVYTDVYLRLTNVSVFANKPLANIHFGCTAYLSKDAYDSGKSSLMNPPVSTALATTVPFAELGSIMLVPYIYYYYSEWLKWKGFTVENVLEPGQTEYTPSQALTFVAPAVPTPTPIQLPVFEVSQQSSEQTQ